MSLLEHKKVKVVLLLLVAVLSFALVSRVVSSEKYTNIVQNSLDEKKKTVVELTTACTAASAAITLIPGDVGTPIAEKLTDLSGYFIIIFCAIYLEKYLFSIMGALAFKFLIPIACLIWSAGIIMTRDNLKRLAVKMIFLGLILFSVIPVSLGISRSIEKNYEKSMKETIEQAKKSPDEIQKEQEEEKEEDGNVIEQFVDKVKTGTGDAIEKMQMVLSNMGEAIAVLLVTTCVIPILVLLLFIWIVRLFFGFDSSEGLREYLRKTYPLPGKDSGLPVLKAEQKKNPGDSA